MRIQVTKPDKSPKAILIVSVPIAPVINTPIPILTKGVKLATVTSEATSVATS